MTPFVDLDLAKHGLGHLTRRHPAEMSGVEIDQVLDAFAAEDMAPPVFDARVDRSRIDDLLGRSYCRGCGKCCLPNPKNPSYPGIEVVEDELRAIIRHFHVSRRAIEKGTTKGGQIRNPNPPYEVLDTRWLTQPCMFHDRKRRQCRIYPLRPLVCKIYPLIFHYSTISLKVNCEYGKDLYRAVVARTREGRRP